jgi:hypothetical protein
MACNGIVGLSQTRRTSNHHHLCRLMRIGKVLSDTRKGEGAMGNGQWAMGNGQWAMGNGERGSGKVL